MSKESKMSPGSETVSLRRIREINRMAKRCDLTPGELQALSYFVLRAYAMKRECEACRWLRVQGWNPRCPHVLKTRGHVLAPIGVKRINYGIYYANAGYACGLYVRSGLVVAHHNMQIRNLWEEYDASAPELRQRIADKINKRDPMCGP